MALQLIYLKTEISEMKKEKFLIENTEKDVSKKSLDDEEIKTINTLKKDSKNMVEEVKKDSGLKKN